MVCAVGQRVLPLALVSRTTDVETWLAGLTTAAIPVTALAASALFLAETIDAWKLLGGALVLGAIVLGAVAQPRNISA